MLWNDLLFESFDFETSGTLPEYALQPWRVAQGKAWATSLVHLRRQDNRTIVRGGLNPTYDMMKAMLEEAIAAGRRLVGWNTVFDIEWLIAYGLEDLVMQCKWLDGMLLWRHAVIEPEYEFMLAGKRRSYGLKPCVKLLWPQHANYADDIDFHDPDPVVRHRLHNYNIRDNIFTLKAAKHWFECLNNRQQAAALIEAECLPLIASANLRGIPVDTLVAHDLKQWLRDTADDCLLRLAPLGVTEKVVRSPMQLGNLLFDVWGLPVVKENRSKITQKVTRSTDKEVLHELALGGIEGRGPDPRVKCVRDYREALGNRAKFAHAPLVSVDYNEDGCTHPRAIVFGTYSGRVTYASKQGKNKDTRQIGFPLHQEKRDKAFRSILTTPLGYTIVEFDASGQEFRWMAIASGDATMLQLCLPGEDAHCFMGARIAELDYQTTMLRHHANDPLISGGQGIRAYGKLANLSLQYRTSAPRLRMVARVDYGIPMTEPESVDVRKTYLATYTGVPIYWKHQISQTKSLGYVETFGGRRVRVEGDWFGPYGWQMASTSINYRIQGTGADQKYLALAVIKPYLRSIGAYFAWDLHDGIYLFVPDAQVAQAVPTIKHQLDNLPYRRAWGVTPPIPMPWDAKIGASWGTLKEWKP